MMRGQLPKILTAMLGKAHRTIGDIQHREMARGLVIDLYVDDGRSVHLMIWRRDVFPSELEWKAVWLCLPTAFFGAMPAPEYKSSLHCKALTAVFPTVRPNPFGISTEIPATEKVEETSTFSERTQL